MQIDRREKKNSLDGLHTESSLLAQEVSELQIANRPSTGGGIATYSTDIITARRENMGLLGPWL